MPRPRGVMQTRPPATPAAPISPSPSPVDPSWELPLLENEAGTPPPPSLLSPTLCGSLKFWGGQVAVPRAPRGYRGAHPGPAPRPPSQPTARSTHCFRAGLCLPWAHDGPVGALPSSVLPALYFSSRSPVPASHSGSAPAPLLPARRGSEASSQQGPDERLRPREG